MDGATCSPSGTSPHSKSDAAHGGKDFSAVRSWEAFLVPCSARSAHSLVKMAKGAVETRLRAREAPPCSLPRWVEGSEPASAP